MGVNVNNNEIKKMVFDTKYESNFPKNKTGKNDRVGMVEGMEHGHKYYGTLTVTYADWSEYKTTLTIEKLLQNREWVQVRDTGEGRFGTFVLLFNSLLAGTFKNEAQKQSDSYFEKVEEMNQQIEKANKETDEAKAVSKKFKAEKEKAELESSVLRADKVLLEGQVENQLMVIQEQQNKIIALEKQVDSIKTINHNKKLSRLVWRKLIREVVTRYNSGTSIDKLVDFVLEFLEK